MHETKVASLEALKASYLVLGQTIQVLEAEIEAEKHMPKLDVLLNGWASLPKTLSLLRACEAMGVSYSTAMGYTKDPSFPAKRHGSRWLVDRDRLRDWMVGRA